MSICPCIVLCREPSGADPGRDERLDGADKLPFGGSSRRRHRRGCHRRAGNRCLHGVRARFARYRYGGERHPQAARADYCRAEPHAQSHPQLLADPVAQPVALTIGLCSAAAGRHAAAITVASRQHPVAAGAADHGGSFPVTDVPPVQSHGRPHGGPAQSLTCGLAPGSVLLWAITGP